METMPAHTAASPVDPSDRDHEAFDRTAPARAALNPTDAPSYTLDAIYAVGAALRTVARVMPLRDDLLGLPKYDIGHLDRLEDYALALRFVHVRLLLQHRRPRGLPALAAEGWRLRRMMLSFADALTRKGLFEPELLERLQGGAGYRDLAKQLTVLVAVLDDLPEALAGPVTEADLSRAAEIADTLGVNVGMAADPDLHRLELLDERRKLGGLLVTAHGQIWRGVAFLRWEERDVDELVPSLYVPPGVRKRRRTTTTSPEIRK